MKKYTIKPLEWDDRIPNTLIAYTAGRKEHGYPVKGKYHLIPRTDGTHVCLFSEGRKQIKSKPMTLEQAKQYAEDHYVKELEQFLIEE